jgi:DNA polymerase-3 subunit gamma/tau
VIGQEHVTEPLATALHSGRTSHAYLFSGPRGCGKTTSARILARCLNCAAGPTPQPCGTCPSCRELGRGGTGSLDVVEIDAASHNGVDDARELRERALYAPTRDRFKIFILDEAHMVTSQGFNALLKVVEEPPEHVKFIFATTEPEKVIGTIRSRTHHYPFRLVPPGIMAEHMAKLCTAEKITCDTGVLPLVVRAGGGSVRDTESVLDQLMAGAHDGVITYAGAVALLGFTPDSLLEAMTAALSNDDGGSAFRVIEQVVEAGQDPRRFAEDFLQRLSDLIVLAAAGQSGEAALKSVPADSLATMREQAQSIGLASLSKAADTINTGLTDMVGATSPRLQLELMVARMLVEAKRYSAGGVLPATVQAAVQPLPQPTAQPPSVNQPAEPQPPARLSTASAPSAAPPNPVSNLATTTPPSTPTSGNFSASAAAPSNQPLTTASLHQAWHQVIARVGQSSKLNRSFVEQHVWVAAVDGQIVTLAVESPGLMNRLMRPNVQEALLEAINALFSVNVKLESTVLPRSGHQLDSRPTPAPTAHQLPPTGVSTASPAGPPPASAAVNPSSPPAADQHFPGSPAHPPAVTTPVADSAVSTQPPSSPAVDAQPLDNSPSDLDPSAEEAGLFGVPLIQRTFNATVIEDVTEP